MKRGVPPAPIQKTGQGIGIGKRSQAPVPLGMATGTPPQVGDFSQQPAEKPNFSRRGVGRHNGTRQSVTRFIKSFVDFTGAANAHQRDFPPRQASCGALVERGIALDDKDVRHAL